jgi:hypothetical protein
MIGLGFDPYCQLALCSIALSTSQVVIGESSRSVSASLIERGVPLISVLSRLSSDLLLTLVQNLMELIPMVFEHAAPKAIKTAAIVYIGG